eukprot:295414-Pyramimonas_sp.AAC.1
MVFRGRVPTEGGERMLIGGGKFAGFFGGTVERCAVCQRADAGADGPHQRGHVGVVVQKGGTERRVQRALQLADGTERQRRVHPLQGPLSVDVHLGEGRALRSTLTHRFCFAFERRSVVVLSGISIQSTHVRAFG